MELEIESSENWHVLCGNEKYGPYSYKNIITMIQKNELMDFNYVWAPHMTEWQQIHNLKEFSADRFALLKKNDWYKEAFIDRKNPRVSTNFQILGHNNTIFFDGQLTSVSEKGAMCLLNTPLVHVGDRVKLHIKSEVENQPAFNVEATVLRKNFSNDRLNSKSGLFYILSFVDIQRVGMEQIKGLLQQAKA